MIEGVRQLARRVADRATARRWSERSRIVERIGYTARAIGESVNAKCDPVPCPYRRQRNGARAKIVSRRGECERTKPSALRIAEDAGEKRVGILAIRFEQQNVRIGILTRIFFHPDLHPRMDDGAKRLQKDERQSATMDLFDSQSAGAVGGARVERHERIDAQQEIDAFIE